MKINFANIDMYERPTLILKKADGTPIGVLGNAANVELEPKYNELSILTFSLPSTVDGEKTPFYDDVNGQMIVELKDVGQFSISSPEESGEKINVQKTVQAQSLECEFGRKKISLPESTYKFFGNLNTDGTVLGMIMELMPNWRVGTVAGSLYNKYRTFEVGGENLYNFIKGTIQKAYNCIFDFDTLTRTVNVRDADDTPASKQVFISRDNLAKDIKVTEMTDDMVTRLDVNGADGVDIRDVNPTGTNYILNLDYFMTTKNFSQALVNKYNAWKALVASQRTPFYNYSIQYSMRVSEEYAENAKLEDLKGEYTSLENIQAVIIQGISQQIRTQADLDRANANLRAKQAEIDAKVAEIDAIASERESLMNNMKSIRDNCAYENYFTEAERKLMDAYIFDNTLQETSFVASEVQAYTDGAGNSITNKTIRATNSEITETQVTSGSTVLSTLYSLKGGEINIAGLITGTVISSVFEKRNNGKIILSVYISNGSYNGTEFPSGCVSVSGEGTISRSGSTITATIPSNKSGYLFFSLNASEYEKRTVSWELYEYAETVLQKMSVPSYSFSVESANFIALEPFELFKNELELGQRVYVQIGSGQILKPVCTGAKLKYGDRPSLELNFNDTFTANDGEAKLIDILDNSVSMGKTLSSGRFTYEAWTESGASTELREFILSALDTAKNAIMSSTEQAVTWDGAGLRLRKWSSSAHTVYEGEQIWINNNSIMMTDDGWEHAKMAIGKIKDDNVGDRWGIIAEMVVGTMLAGEELVIESQKKSGSKTGDTTMFRVDADGCRLYNADFQIQKTTGSTTTQILLDPSVGVAMGTYPLKKADGTLNKDNAKFFVDTDGTMTLSGTIYTYKGIIGGWTISTDGLYSGSTDVTSVGMTSTGSVRIWAGKKASTDEDRAKSPFYVKQDGFLSAIYGKVGGWYIGDKSSTYYIGNESTKANSTVGMYSSNISTDVVFWAGDKLSGTPKFKVTAGGALTSISGNIGGWYIGSDYIGNASTKANSTVGLAFSTSSSAYTIWSGGTQTGTTGTGGCAKFRVRTDGRVEASDLVVTGGSITIKSGDTETFKVESDGKLTAIYGKVGGWYIGDKSSTYYIGNNSTKANSTVGMYSSSTATDIVFWAGGKPAENPLFSVTAGGKITAANMDITGGKIGGWFIGTDYIGSANTKQLSYVGLANVEGSAVAFWAGNSGSDPAGANFRVQNDGTVFASNLNITGGTITITKDGATTFRVESTGHVDASDLHITGGSITLSTVFSVDSNGYMTALSGKIGGWFIGSDYIGNMATKDGSYVGMVSSNTVTDVVFWAGGVRPSITDASLRAPFMVTRGGALYSSNIDVKGGSIEIKNAAEQVTFAVSNAGALTAKSGQIGGWNISEDHLWINGSGDVFWAGSDSAVTADFKVNADGTVTAKKGLIGGWTFNSKRLHCGGEDSGHTTYVCLNSDADTDADDKDYAIWCGKLKAKNAPFRVKRDGKVYISALMVWDGTAWQEIDFSGNFKDAVVLQSSGTWSDGDQTFTATIKMFGKINKTISMSAKSEITSITVDSSMYNDQYAVINVVYKKSVNGKQSGPLSTSYNQVNVRPIATLGWQLASGKISYTDGAKSVTIPRSSSYGNTTTLDISKTFDAGVKEGESHFTLTSVTLEGVLYNGTGKITPIGGTKITVKTHGYATLYYKDSDGNYQSLGAHTWYHSAGDGTEYYTKGTEVTELHVKGSTVTDTYYTKTG